MRLERLSLFIQISDLLLNRTFEGHMMTPSVLTKVGFCIGISVTALGCGDHGLKIHEQPPTASLRDPADNDTFV